MPVINGANVEISVSPQLDARVIAKKACVVYDVIVSDCTVISANALMNTCVWSGCNMAVDLSVCDTANTK